MAFWGEQLGPNSKDPKRKFRFKVEIGDLGSGIVWYAKSVTKPELSVPTVTEHKFMGHTFKFPGSVSWNQIECTLVDPVDEDAAKKTLQIFKAAGYIYPDGGYADENNEYAMTTMSKSKAVAALQKFVIYQLDANNNVVEKWELHNAFLTKVSFTELSYDSEDLSEISLTIDYDWATFTDAEGNSDLFNGQ